VLENIKQGMGSEAFVTQYEQEPAPPSGNLLKKAWLRYYETEPCRQSGDQIVQSWDTAMKPTDTSDYSVCLTFLVRNKNQYHLIDIYRDRPEFPDLAKFVASHAKKYAADAILIEDKGSGTSLIQTAKGLGLQGIVTITPKTDKSSRAYGQTPKLEAGSLMLPKTAPWLADFVGEYLVFPNSRHDDQIDALSQFLEWQSNREAFEFSCDWGWD
jgi:predicted phage terminase large subunit-like protein